MHNPQLTMITVRKGLGGVALLQEVCQLDGFQVSKAHARPSLSNLSACCLQIKMESSQLWLQHLAHLLPAMMVIDSPSETVSEPQLNAFFYGKVLVMVSPYSNRK